MTSKLVVFPDTNLFLQCKPLQELDWSLIDHHGDVDILITRPVQAEIDEFKAKGNSRQASRARTISSLLGELLETDDDWVELRQRPLVRVTVDLELDPDPAKAKELKYDTRDGQLVGMALNYHLSNPDALVALVTFDNGPLLSAKRVKLPFKKVPDAWMLPPEPDEGAKREAALKKQIELLQNSEPRFEISVEGATGPIHEVRYDMYGPLSLDETEELLLALFTEYPEAKEFGPAEAFEKVVSTEGFSTSSYSFEKEVFTPATVEQIEKYRGAYAAWKSRCRDYLGLVHEQLNKRLTWPTITPLIENVGSRPAEDSLIELEAKGPFAITRLAKKSEDESASSEKSEVLRLPRPPLVPKGQTKRVRTGPNFDARPATDSSADILVRQNQLSRTFDVPFRPPFAKDPNAFYWEASTEGYPVGALALRCQQWRHARPVERFPVGLMFRREPGTYSGSLEVSVHAANLSAPAKLVQPIRFVVSEVSPSAEVKKLIADLALPSPFIQLGEY